MSNDKLMQDYYNFRVELKDLYCNDVKAKGDLPCKVLEIRDKNRCVTSMNVDIGPTEGKIVMEFDSNTSEKKRKSITDNITNSIGRFIVDNRDNINVDNDLFDTIMNNGTSYCDIYTIGDEVIFGLF